MAEPRTERYGTALTGAAYNLLAAIERADRANIHGWSVALRKELDAYLAGEAQDTAASSGLPTEEWTGLPQGVLDAPVVFRQDTAASSGLPYRYPRPGRGVSKEYAAGFVAARSVLWPIVTDQWTTIREAERRSRDTSDTAALAQPIPEPSLRDALAAALHATCGGNRHWTDRDEPSDIEVRRADAIIAALPGLSLSAQPSEPGETT